MSHHRIPIAVYAWMALSLIVLAPVRAEAQWVWQVGTSTNHVGCCLVLNIGLAPQGPGHSAGCTYSVNGGAWKGCTADWMSNKKNAYGGVDELWRGTICGLKHGDKVQYALYGDFGMGKVWDNNGTKNYQVTFTTPLEFYIPQSFYAGGTPTDYLKSHFQTLVHPYTTVTVPAIGVRKYCGSVKSAKLYYTTDYWKTKTQVDGATRPGKVYTGNGNYAIVNPYHFTLAQFAPQTQVEFFLEAEDSTGQQAFLPGNWKNFSFQVASQAPARPYLADVSYNETAKTAEVLFRAPISSTPEAGMVYATSSACVPRWASESWKQVEAQWVGEEHGQSLWVARAPLGDDQSIKLALYSRVNGLMLWDNNQMRDYQARFQMCLPEQMSLYASGELFPMTMKGPKPKLFLYYNFEDDFQTTGALKDHSGNGHTLTLQGGSIAKVAGGLLNNAGSFQNGQFVSTTNPTASLSKITISFFFRSPSPSTNYKMMSAAWWSGGVNASGWVIGTHCPESWRDGNKGDACDRTQCKTGWSGPTFPFASNQWTHVAVTHDLVRMRLYINGQLVNDCPSYGEKIGVGKALQLGAWCPYSGTCNGFQYVGMLDEVRVYDGALTVTEMKNLYKTTLTGSPSPF